MAPSVRASVQDLGAGGFDLLVIGGGITGAGIAREAALRGLSTALVDAGDFGEGTSSRSSRLIHGGLRYLEQGRISLVREALRERRILLRLAPHLVRPLPFLFPVFQGDRVPRWKLSLGLALYDLLAAGGNVRRHRTLGKRALLEAEPLIRDLGLTGGAL
jgi:glycerol-3-phosphate dehydrogenase